MGVGGSEGAPCSGSVASCRSSPLLWVQADGWTEEDEEEEEKEEAHLRPGLSVRCHGSRADRGLM